MKRKFLRNSIIIVAVLAFLGVFYGLAYKNTPETDATVKATDFNAGRIIDDEVFYNANTMTVDEIQAHLDKYSASCDMWGEKAIGYGRSINGKAVDPTISRREYARLMREAGRSDYHDAPYVCISKYYENPTTHTTNYDTNGEAQEGMISAAQIIYDAAQKYSINPQVLLVMLKKESYVWGDTWPLKNEYNTVMGYGCPDNAACDAKYYGFYNQVMKAAWQLNYYKEHIYSYGYYPYMTNNIYYSPNTSCGTKAVYLENIATTSLYIYTPYTPNDAALANYPGEAYCGSYGNRNFFMYFNEWFGSTTFVKELTLINDYAKNINYLGNELENSFSYTEKYCYKKYEYGYVISNGDNVWDIHGGIFTKWDEMGGAMSVLGMPTASETYNNGNALQTFENGVIYWSNATNGIEIHGGILEKWNDSSVQSTIGYPVSDEEYDVFGNAYQDFENGRIYWNNVKGSWIIGKFAEKLYANILAENNYLGYPTGLPICGIKDNGCYQLFDNGRIYWASTTGTASLHGGIIEKWYAEGLEWGNLGYPTTGEKYDDIVGTYQDFQGGRIYWSNEYGTITIRDFALSLWLQSGGVSGYLGMPLDSGSCTGEDVCFQNFTMGRVYRDNAGNTVEVHGGIYERWLKGNSYLGLPLSIEQYDASGNTYQKFENGKIYWNSSRGTWIQH